MVVVGLASSAVGATAWRNRVADDEREELTQRAETVAATTASLIQREVDVIDGAMKLLEANGGRVEGAEFQR